MPVAVKLDEDLSPLVAEPLIAAGYPVATVVEQGWGGMKDPELWPRIVAEGRFLITGDKGFGDIRIHPPGTHPGLLILSPDRESIVAYRSLLEEVLRRHQLADFKGAVVVASPGRVRIRRAASR